MVVGGASRTPGGVLLAGLAALRVGAGSLQLALAESVAPASAATFPEAGVIPLAETPEGSVVGTAAAERLHDLVEASDAVLVGPGLDDADEATSLLAALLPGLGDVAVVLDAYALGAIAGDDEVAQIVRARSTPAVLTPNSTELGLLAGTGDPGTDDVVDVARRYGCCVTSQSTIATSDGRAWSIPLGHSGLATAGSGDVLAGLVVGLLARGADADQSACWGTYLHAMAGERLSSAVGGVGFLARELVEQVPPVLAELS
jgi:ADP-dependent NAD(P)H-hydrate dehydratase